MKLISTNRRSGAILLIVFLCFSITLANWESAQTQTKLSLTDILTGLRSKKATMVNKNKLLTKGVQARGVSFNLTPEIEKELRKEGASDELISAIKEKQVKPTPIPTPTPTPAWLVHAIRGNDYFDKHDFDNAINEYDKSIQINSQNADAYIQRGFALSYKGEIELAEADYQSAIAINPNLNNEPSIKCVSYGYKQGIAEEAIENCSKSISTNPFVALFYFKRGTAYQTKTEYNQSVSDYTKAIELEPNFFGAYYNRGLIYITQGNYNWATADLDKVILLNPKLTNAYIRRGWIYEKQKNYEKAIADYKDALQIDPNNEEAKNKLSAIGTMVNETHKKGQPDKKKKRQ
jgi:tetratricopeptide (TPR) repeat protein